MTTPKGPPCPNCGRPMKPQGDLFHCGKCDRFYDDNPNEGGSAHNNPERSAIGKEERERKKKGGRR